MKFGQLIAPTVVYFGSLVPGLQFEKFVKICQPKNLQIRVQKSRSVVGQ